MKNGILIPECGVVYGGNLSETDMDIISSKDFRHKVFEIGNVCRDLSAEYLRFARSRYAGLPGTGFLRATSSGKQRDNFTERCHRGFDNSIIDYEIRKTLFDNNYKLFQRFWETFRSTQRGLLSRSCSAKSSLDLEKLI